MLNIISRRYWFFVLSLLVIIPGLIALAVWELPLAIDFTGGTLLEVRFESGEPPSPAEVVVLFEELDINTPWVQSAGATDIVVRSKPINEAIKTNVINQMENRFGGPITVVRFDTIGPSMGEEVVIQTLYAIGLTMLGIMVYIIYTFREVPHAFRYGLTAIISIMHDVAVVVGIEAIFGHFLGWEIDLLFPISLLIIISFSAYDSIVIFDRIRENLRVHRRLDYETLVNHSILQTLDRSIITRLTVMLAILAILLFGGVTTRQFAIILLIGLFSGTYSSIFIASPILVLWENREWRWWFSRKNARTG
ncbi:MAG: protein translocase subunit SecF [Anaerolineales bacterium]